MTGAEIVTAFEGLIDDTIDSTLAYQLLNSAKNKLEGEREWSYLKKVDSSNSATTSAITLPTDWNRTLSVFVNTQPYMQIPFEQKHLLVNTALSWYLDVANNCFYLLGSNISGTVHHFYIKQTDDVTSGTSPTFPSRFHMILAYEMAEMYFAVDQGDRGRSWDDKFAVYKELLRRSMVDWDVALQKRAVESAVPYDFNPEVGLGNM